jgi:formylglycine-generating enzyme required for sulfatase activity
MRTLLTLLLLALPGARAQGPRPGMVGIEAGEVVPLYPVAGETRVPVAPFRIDAMPVTVASYRSFLEVHPEWWRSRVPAAFAAPGYLRRWASDTDPGGLDPDAPVTSVSWFAAAAYCDARGARLPNEAEWEYVAAAGATHRDGRLEPGFRERVLAATLDRSAEPGPVGRGAPNAWGVYDLHGLVWEWVFDVGSGFNTADSRQDGDRKIALVCGGASVGASDKTDYAAFLRYAYRGTLTGDYSGAALGFRCAADGGTP